MPSLAKQSHWMPRARRWLATSAMLAGLAIVCQQVLPRFARLVELHARQSAAERELAAARAQVAELQPAKGQALGGGSNAHGGAVRQFTSDPDSWVRRMTQMSGSHRLRAVTVQAGVPQQSGQVWRVPLVLNFEGGYLDAATFLQDAERLPATVRISTLHVHCTDLPTGEVEVQVAMNAFVPGEP